MIYRSILILVVGGGLVTLTLLAVQLDFSWRMSQRLAVLESHFSDAAQIRELERLLDNEDPAALHDATLLLDQIRNRGGFLDPGMHRQLMQIGELLNTPQNEQAARREVRALLTEVHGNPSERRQTVRDLRKQALLEQRTGLFMVLSIPLLVLAVLFYVRRRLGRQLSDLGYLMDLLSKKEYAQAVLDHVDPPVRPLFEKYNRMAEHMRKEQAQHQDLERRLLEETERKELALGQERRARIQAERESRKREGSLRQDVDSATQALLHQQVALDRSERLAAIGDLSARLAHKLRNPLSGVLMALNNLSAEIEVADQKRRIDIVIGELERVVELLNRVLSDARAEPEAIKDLALSPLVEELLTLIRYQLPPRVTVHNRIPKGLHCRLPATATRSALMNLVLNAAQAILEQNQDGAVEIDAAMVDQNLLLDVKDNGSGFAPEILEEGPHDYLSRRQGGTGLGLAMVRRFVNHQSGRIELRNQAQGGAWVRLVIPQEPHHE